MMYRTKSFNINMPEKVASLRRSQSSPNLASLSFNARASLMSKPVSFREVLNSVNTIKTHTLQDKWEYKNKEFEELDEELDKESYEERIKWNQRSSNTISMIQWGVGSLLKNEDDQEKYRYFVSYFRGVPVGAVIFSPEGKHVSDIPEVMLLVTHPGIRGCGILLMECAVNESKNLEKEGKVQVLSITSAKNAYTSMGFIPMMQRNLLLLLEPSKSPQWVLKQDRYQFIGT